MKHRKWKISFSLPRNEEDLLERAGGRSFKKHIAIHLFFEKNWIFFFFFFFFFFVSDEAPEMENVIDGLTGEGRGGAEGYFPADCLGSGFADEEFDDGGGVLVHKPEAVVLQCGGQVEAHNVHALLNFGLK